MKKYRIKIGTTYWLTYAHTKAEAKQIVNAFLMTNP